MFGKKFLTTDHSGKTIPMVMVTSHFGDMFHQQTEKLVRVVGNTKENVFFPARVCNFSSVSKQRRSKPRPQSDIKSVEISVHPLSPSKLTELKFFFFPARWAKLYEDPYV